MKVKYGTFLQSHGFRFVLVYSALCPTKGNDCILPPGDSIGQETGENLVKKQIDIVELGRSLLSI